MAQSRVFIILVFALLFAEGYGQCQTIYKVIKNAYNEQYTFYKADANNKTGTFTRIVYMKSCEAHWFGKGSFIENEKKITLFYDRLSDSTQVEFSFKYGYEDFIFIKSIGIDGQHNCSYAIEVSDSNSDYYAYYSAYYEHCDLKIPRHNARNKIFTLIILDKKIITFEIPSDNFNSVTIFYNQENIHPIIKAKQEIIKTKDGLVTKAWTKKKRTIFNNERVVLEKYE